MAKVTSPDGTPIAYQGRGAGPPLVLVHGTGAANPLAWPAVATLEEQFNLYAVDRRGRGESGDTDPYAIEREFEDLAAVIDAIGEPAHLLGHSFGGLCALEAALRTPNIRKLVLYEPLSLAQPGQSFYPDGFIDGLQTRLAAGDRAAVVTEFYREVVGMSPAEVEQFKASPAWPARLASAPTLPRELQAEAQYTFDPQRFRTLLTPTLLLTGSDSPDFLKRGTDVVAAALPNCRVVVMPGQDHIAMYTAPALFAAELIGFLLDELQP
jgi:pimeloyl-ACP methyl ester carboxylesterase